MAPTLFNELKMFTGQKKTKIFLLNAFFFHVPDLKYIEEKIKMFTGIKLKQTTYLTKVELCFLWPSLFCWVPKSSKFKFKGQHRDIKKVF